jgi:signal transduction histidine kinase/DNA-binding response OmpR family regulator
MTISAGRRMATGEYLTDSSHSLLTGPGERENGLPAPETEREKVNILIVDDRPDKAFALEAAIAALDEHVIRVHSGAEALRELLRRDFAVILLDVKMPVMDGFDTAAMIRQRPRSELTPIIFVSAANDTENLVSRGYSLGAVDYILAPIEPEILRAKVAVFVQLFRMTQQIRRQGEERAQRIRAEAAREEAEAARERSAFLAEAGRILSASLEFTVTCTALARLGVPRLADCCVIDLVNEEGSIMALTVAHRDPAKEAALQAYRESFPMHMTDPSGPGAVIRTGVPDICLDFNQSAAELMSSGGEQLAALMKLGVTAYVIVPLRSRGKVMGALGLVSTSPQRFRESDLSLFEELAERAGLAFENATLYSEAQEARKEAERANRAKDQFLAMLSHELRTPLTPVLATIAMLEGEEDLPEPVAESLRMMHQNVELEARLIDDLLDLTRINKGKVQLKLEPVNAHKLLESAVEICRAEIRTKELDLRMDLAARHSVFDADSARLQQVFWNLIKNSVKFTPNGGQIEIRTADGPANTFHLEIRDTGAGIAPEALPKIFEAFEQGTAKRQGGLGLGLAISKAMVELHGGHIRAFSEGPDRGSRFEVDFPTEQSHLQHENQLDRPRETSAERVTARVLLVEDHLDTLMVMERVLRKRGYEVRAAESVTAALGAAGEFSFDLLVSDMGLPDGSGVDLIRGLLETRPVRGVALSGYGMEDDIRRSREAGFIEHITKPVDIDLLDQVLQRIMRA